ncbi:hypothetical protein KRE40_12235 [Elizabethkingia meningoseptica]|uniref:hypothetical protein n=1 Tax=Elizabethkingia TaxID=308865 RepID=UPI0023AF12BD|nr:hypothetical protein [Elizabethkingia meningoseptica]MDE5509412.1 hypothetical protein [Elizabethkingia meningoseptica]HAY3534664.1 hypothetical protein [Elizabethkingia anophelis]HAY3546780.1 hypothetical protein [Elizabethkingia anophelis]
MKHFILSAAIFFSAFLSAQQITSIENKGSELYINNSITLKKGEDMYNINFLYIGTRRIECS